MVTRSRQAKSARAEGGKRQPRRIVVTTFAGSGTVPGVSIDNSAQQLEEMSSPARPTLDRSRALSVLRETKSILAERFGVLDLALFGSFARDSARPDSDVDVLVSFSGPATSARYFGVQFFLEDALGRPVDLVTTSALRAELKPVIEREATRV